MREWIQKTLVDLALHMPSKILSLWLIGLAMNLQIGEVRVRCMTIEKSMEWKLEPCPKYISETEKIVDESSTTTQVQEKP